MLKFFWRQPTYQSELDTFLKQIASEDPLLNVKKEAAMKAMQKEKAATWADFFRQDVTRTPQL